MKDQASKLRSMVSDRKKDKKIKVISVISGLDSTGKTSLVMGLAIELKNKGKNVLVLDLTKDSNNFLNYINFSKIGIIDYSSGPLIHIEDQLIRGPKGIDILLGAESILKIRKLDKAKRIKALNRIGFLSEYDFILIDNQAGLSEDMLTFTNFTNDVILITQSGLDNIVSAYKLIKIFASNNIKDKIYLVINKIESEKEGKEYYEKLKSTSEKFLGFSLNNLGNIYYDKKMENLNNKKLNISSYNKNISSNEDILKIANKILLDKTLISNTYTIKDIQKRAKMYFK